MKLRSLIEQELDYPIKNKPGFNVPGTSNTDFGRSVTSDFYNFYRNPNLDDKPEGLFTDMSMVVYEKFPETGEQLSSINDLAMEFYENIGDPKAKDVPGNYDVKSDETIAEFLFSKINLINITSKDILSQIEKNGDFKALDLERIESALEEMNQKIQGPAPQTNIEPVGFKINEMKKTQLRKIIRKSIKEVMNEQQGPLGGGPNDCVMLGFQTACPNQGSSIYQGLYTYNNTQTFSFDDGTQNNVCHTIGGQPITNSNYQQYVGQLFTLDPSYGPTMANPGPPGTWGECDVVELVYMSFLGGYSTTVELIPASCGGTCPPANPISGCMDSTAQNYDPLATVDDGSCIAHVYGCMDPLAMNYYPGATMDDPSMCIFEGCADSNANNYDPQATYGCDHNMPNPQTATPPYDTSCCTYTLAVLDCNDPAATNYNSAAYGCDNGSGFCDDPQVTGYNPVICKDNDSCCVYPPNTPPKPKDSEDGKEDKVKPEPTVPSGKGIEPLVVKPKKDDLKERMQKLANIIKK
tara:strand:- start:87 stop:1652 length:1566 start_codon:yes stop_codon:yes gene_type:complete